MKISIDNKYRRDYLLFYCDKYKINIDSHVKYLKLKKSFKF